MYKKIGVSLLFSMLEETVYYYFQTFITACKAYVKKKISYFHNLKTHNTIKRLINDNINNFTLIYNNCFQCTFNFYYSKMLYYASTMDEIFTTSAH